MDLLTITGLADAARRHSPALPVNIYGIIRAHGIDVHYIRASDKFTGVYTCVEGQPVILLNQRNAAVRRRFTAAHELYHHLSCERDETETRPLFSGCRTSLGAEEMAVERCADRFATAILMPAAAVAEIARQGLTREAMARHFCVSMEAMRIRLLGLMLEDVLERI